MRILLVLLFICFLTPAFGYDKVVVATQQALRSQGFPVSIDGAIGPQTRKALKGFQSKFNLQETGKLDFDTRRLIYLHSGVGDLWQNFDSNELETIREDIRRAVGHLENDGPYFLIFETEKAFSSYFSAAKLKRLELETMQLKSKATVQLLTVSENVKSRLFDAIDTMKMVYFWNGREEHNLGTSYSFLNYPCSQDCSGHYAGYKWSAVNNISHSADCINQSTSFERGCNLFINGD